MFITGPRELLGKRHLTYKMRILLSAENLIRDESPYMVYFWVPSGELTSLSGNCLLPNWEVFFPFWVVDLPDRELLIVTKKKEDKNA